MTKIAPSILAADFAKLELQIRQLEDGGADWIHLDVMDGHFVPNITFGPMIVRAIRSLSALPLDTHLMIENPDRYVEDFRNAGSDRITVHAETCPHLHRTVQRVRELGAKPGVAINPATPAPVIEDILPHVDLVLVMTVNPGFGGQQFIPQMVSKVHQVASMLAAMPNGIELEVDGGIDQQNAAQLVSAGATVLVAGHSIFSQSDVCNAVRLLRAAARPS